MSKIQFGFLLPLFLLCLITQLSLFTSSSVSHSPTQSLFPPSSAACSFHFEPFGGGGKLPNGISELYVRQDFPINRSTSLWESVVESSRLPPTSTLLSKQNCAKNPFVWLMSFQLHWRNLARRFLPHSVLKQALLPTADSGKTAALDDVNDDDGDGRGRGYNQICLGGRTERSSLLVRRSSRFVQLWTFWQRQTIVPSVAKYPLLDTTVVSYRVHAGWGRVTSLGNIGLPWGHRMSHRKWKIGWMGYTALFLCDILCLHSSFKSIFDPILRKK